MRKRVLATGFGKKLTFLVAHPFRHHQRAIAVFLHRLVHLVEELRFIELYFRK